jgi:tRNA modification GTPase
VRISGRRAVDLCAGFLRLVSGPLAAAPVRTLRRATVVDPASKDIVDEVLCAVMRAPRSFTGEDLVEISCHGNPVLLRRVVSVAVAAGARLASPGEFTRRAFLNGRIDLAQAEAVSQLINARTERAVAQAARALAGGLSGPLHDIRERLLDLIAGLEVAIDFPDDGFGPSPDDAAKEAERLASETRRLLQSARQGRVVHEGLTIAIVGAPNAGKSSLFNALLAMDRAIVSPIPGTTRDLVEGALAISGVPIRLIDTAGLGATDHPLEAEGMRRTRRAITESDLLMVVIDGSVPRAHPSQDIVENKEYLVVVNKADLTPAQGPLAVGLQVSALTGLGMDGLVKELRAWIDRRVESDGDEGGIVATLRQIELLDSVEQALARGVLALRGGVPIEAALVDLREALAFSGTVIGVGVEEAVLNRIFSTFCLGK